MYRIGTASYRFVREWQWQWRSRGKRTTYGLPTWPGGGVPRKWALAPYRGPMNNACVVLVRGRTPHRRNRHHRLVLSRPSSSRIISSSDPGNPRRIERGRGRDEGRKDEEGKEGRRGEDGDRGGRYQCRRGEIGRKMGNPGTWWQMVDQRWGEAWLPAVLDGFGNWEGSREGGDGGRPSGVNTARGHWAGYTAMRKLGYRFTGVSSEFL